MGDYSGGGAHHLVSAARACSPPQGGSRRGRRPSTPRFALGSGAAEPQPPYGVIRPHLPWIRGAPAARTRVAGRCARDNSTREKGWGHILPPVFLNTPLPLEPSRAPGCFCPEKPVSIRITESNPPPGWCRRGWFSIQCEHNVFQYPRPLRYRFLERTRTRINKQFETLQQAH